MEKLFVIMRWIENKIVNGFILMLLLTAYISPLLILICVIFLVATLLRLI